MLYITVAVVINTTACDSNLILASHTAGRHVTTTPVKPTIAHYAVVIQYNTMLLDV